jgi:glycerate dehydrogenase
MQMHTIVVTVAMSEVKRAMLESILGEEVRLSFLANTPSNLREQTLSEATVLFSWLLPKELGSNEFSLLKNVQMIQLLSAGANHVPFTKLPLSIIVAGNIGAYAEPMAEHILAMTLALAKNLLKEHLKLAQGVFNQSTLNRLLRGSVCGIIGFGGIGRATARLMRGLGMRIYAVNTSGKTDESVDFIGTMNDLQHVLSSSDVVVITVPLTKATRHCIEKRELEWMKPDAILINVARGDVIGEEALYTHLLNHPDFKAGIDAWWIEPLHAGEFHTEYPFFSLPNVLGSPHNSTLVPGQRDEAIKRAAENISRFLKGVPVSGVVRRDDYI